MHKPFRRGKYGFGEKFSCCKDMFWPGSKQRNSLWFEVQQLRECEVWIRYLLTVKKLSRSQSWCTKPDPLHQFQPFLGDFNAFLIHQNNLRLDTSGPMPSNFLKMLFNSIDPSTLWKLKCWECIDWKLHYNEMLNWRKSVTYIMRQCIFFGILKFNLCQSIRMVVLHPCFYSHYSGAYWQY